MEKFNIDKFEQVLALLEARCDDSNAVKNLKPEKAWTELSRGTTYFCF